MATTTLPRMRTGAMINPARILGGLVPLAGGALLVTGALLPWLSFFGGLIAPRGVSGTNGRVLAATGAVAIVLALVQLARPSVRTQWALAATGVVASGMSAWVIAQLLDAYRAAQADLTLVAQLRPGAFICAAGAVLVLSAVLAPSAASRPAAVRQPARALAQRSALVLPAVVMLVAAALVHLAVLGAHLQEWVLYGMFFLAVAVAQIAAAALLWYRQSRVVLGSVAIGSVLVAGFWLFTRIVAVPFGPGAGQAEDFGFADITASIFELAVAVIAVALLLPVATRVARTRPAWAVAVALSAGLGVLGVAAVIAGSVAG